MASAINLITSASRANNVGTSIGRTMEVFNSVGRTRAGLRVDLRTLETLENTSLNATVSAEFANINIHISREIPLV